MTPPQKDNSIEKRRWPAKPPPTAEDLAAIAVLDELRSGKGDKPPQDLPLACIVKVTEYVDIHKANEAYAMVKVSGPHGTTWRMCVYRGVAKVGRNMLFVSGQAALPIEERYRNPAACTVKEKIYKYGFGAKARRLLPHVKRHIYCHNSGVLYPLENFPELKGKRAGTAVAVLLRIDNAEEMKIRQNLPRSQMRLSQATAMAQAQEMLRRMRALAGQ